MARLSREDWLEEGLRLLAEFAQDQLKITYLCDRLGVTRGSFYHHFESIGHYLEELMQTWEKKNTHELIRVASQAKSPEQRMQLLNQQVGKSNQSVEAAIRSWSFYEPLVKEHLRRVDSIRLTYLQGIFEELGFSQEMAQNRAQLEYATLIGLQQLYPDITAQEMEHLWQVYSGKK